ncbi:MAG: hypothetical protein ABSE50_24210 [Xanthobacteraceae bacterium]
MANCITIRGSFVGNREDMAETLAFAAEGKVKAHPTAAAGPADPAPPPPPSLCSPSVGVRLHALTERL